MSFTADIECNAGHGCEYQCAKINGANQCSCQLGYQLANDGLTCQGKWLQMCLDEMK